MKLSYRTYTLKLREPIGAKVSKEVVFLEIEHEDIIGIGEASPSERMGETTQSILEFFMKIDEEYLHSLFDPSKILAFIEKMGPGNNAAKAAIDMAVNDWMAKVKNMPLWRMFKLSPLHMPRSTYTITGTTLEEFEKKIRQADSYPYLKLKLGFDNDIEIVKELRVITDKPFYVDVDEGWSPKENAYEKILILQSLGIQFVEQPLKANDLEGMRWLKNRVRVKLIAEESCVAVQNLVSLKGLFDGVNLKLMKCGGLMKSLQLIYTAKRILGMSVMIGSTLESSVGISAALQISPLAELCHLDGNLHLQNDPYVGAHNHSGILILNDQTGIGVSRSETFPHKNSIT